MNTTPKPKATKNNKGEFVGELLGELVCDGSGLDDVVERGNEVDDGPSLATILNASPTTCSMTATMFAVCSQYTGLQIGRYVCVCLAIL